MNEDQPERNMAWVDTETTGLSPRPNKGNSRVIDLAIVVTDPHLNVLDMYETKIKLSVADRASFHPKAMVANGYTDEEWANAPENSLSIWERVHKMTKGLLICGQNVPFDKEFLESEMMRYNLKPQWDRRDGELMLLSMRVYQTSSIPNMKLENVYAEIGGPKLLPHRALPDVLRTMYLYWKIVASKDGRSPGETFESFETLMKSVALPEQIKVATSDEIQMTEKFWDGTLADGAVA